MNDGLISDDYRKLNTELHHSDERYGTGAFRWSEMISNLRAETESNTVLDYGCGKGSLGIALGRPEWFSEYDPAVPGKDVPPDTQRDMVVCTDVLEHVEPEKLDEVLEHLRHLAKKALFVVIATRPSTKALADGRNAHLIQQSSDWWKEKLERYFRVVSWSSEGHEIIGVCRRLHMLGDLKVISAVSETIRFEQAARNCGVVKRRLFIQHRHNRRAVVACYGPSLKDSVPEISAEQQAGALVVSVSGAHDFLISHGVIPDVHVDVDPREHKAFFTRNPHPKIQYWIASCCHPKLIDQLLGYDLSLWHIWNGDEDARIISELDAHGFLVGGGGSVGCRAVNILYLQGYRSFSIYGMDCCFDSEGEQHAGPHSGKPQKGLLAKCGTRWFKTSGTLVAIARGFLENMDALEKASREEGEPQPFAGDCIETIIHGGGLLAGMVSVGTQDVTLDVSEEAHRESDVIRDGVENGNRARSVA